MQIFLNRSMQPVTVVRLRPASIFDWTRRVDHTVYKHPRIWAVIPAYKDSSGVIRALITGKVVPIREWDEIRDVHLGDAFNYPDGSKLIYTRRWNGKEFEYFFTERTCRDSECVVINVFGENLSEPPIIKK